MILSGTLNENAAGCGDSILFIYVLTRLGLGPLPHPPALPPAHAPHLINLLKAMSRGHNRHQKALRWQLNIQKTTHKIKQKYNNTNMKQQPEMQTTLKTKQVLKQLNTTNLEQLIKSASLHTPSSERSADHKK